MDTQKRILFITTEPVYNLHTVIIDEKLQHIRRLRLKLLENGFPWANTPVSLF